MESPLSFFRMHGDHEPCEWSAELLFGTMPAGRMQNTVPNWSSALRFMESPHVVNAMHWDHEPRTSQTLPPTRCCRRPVGRASLRFLCRQDAGSTLGFMESLMVFGASDSVRGQPVHFDRAGLDIYGVVGQKHNQRERECDVVAEL